MKVTNESRLALGQLIAGLGGDNTDTEDLPDPIDRALDVNGGVAMTLTVPSPTPVQTAEADPAGSVAPEFPSPPTVGNTVFLWKTYAATPPALKSGFTNIASVSQVAGNTRTGRLMYRIVQPGDDEFMCAGDDAQANVRYAASEWTGVFDGTSFVAQSTATNGGSPGPFECGGDVTPPTSDDYVIIGFASIGQGSNEPAISSLTPGTDVTEMQEIPLASFPWTWTGYKAAPAASGPYTVDGTIAAGDARAILYSGVTVALQWGSTSWSVPAPDVNDGDDATCEEITGPNVVAIQLDTTYRIVRARLRIATETAGSRTYKIFGSNTGDFSVEDELVSVTFTAIGSDTPQDVAFNWSTATAYEFYRLEGDNETRCIHAFELYGPVAATSEDLDAHILDPIDAHDASAVSFTPTAGIAATDVQAAIVEDAGDLVTHAADVVAHTIPKRTVTTTDPTTGDDTGDGYTIGSRWVNTTSDEEFVATDVTAAAAVWVSTTEQGSGSVPSGTAVGDILVWDGAAWDVLPVGGTDGDVLTEDSGETLGLKYAPGSGGGLVLLEQHTASASATLDFTTCISSTYDEYQIEFLNVLAATNNSNFLMRVGTGGGPTYDTGSNYYWQEFTKRLGGGDTTQGGTSTSAQLAGDGVGTSNNSSYGVSGSMRFFNPGGALLGKYFNGVLHWYYNTGADTVTSTVRGLYGSTTAITALRFFFAAGNITSGTIRIYGIEK